MPEGPCFMRCPDGALLYDFLARVGYGSTVLTDPYTMQSVPADQRVGRALVYDARPALPVPMPALNTDSVLWCTLRQIAEMTGDRRYTLVPPACTEVLLGDDEHAWEAVADGLEGERLVMIFNAQGHWACLEMRVQEGRQLNAIAHDGLCGRSLREARRLAHAIAKLKGLTVGSVKERNVFPQIIDGTCGPVALLHAGLVLAGSMPSLTQVLTQLRPRDNGGGRMIGHGSAGFCPSSAAGRERGSRGGFRGSSQGCSCQAWCGGSVHRPCSQKPMGPLKEPRFSPQFPV